MPESHLKPTQDLLIGIGYSRDSSGFSYDFGFFELRGIAVTNHRFEDVILFLGTIITPPSITYIEFEIPDHLETLEQCAALITWHLERSLDRREFIHISRTRWVAIGRLNKLLVPHERTLAEYRDRPSCSAHPDWTKLALRTLAHQLEMEGIEDNEAVIIEFDGKILSFKSADIYIALAGSGDPWKSSYYLPVSTLKKLPKRMKSNGWVGIWKSTLTIAGHDYEGVAEYKEDLEQAVNADGT